MPLINSQGQMIEDGWLYPDADRKEQLQPRCVVPFETLSELGPGGLVDGPLGVLVEAGITADQLVPFLHEVELVVIEFPKFRDGRGFTVARALRGRHGFQGDIRAIGHILPDQLAALTQCGFTSIVTPVEHPPEQWVRNEAPNSMNAGPLLQRLIGRRAVVSATADEKNAIASGSRSPASRRL